MAKKTCYYCDNVYDEEEGKCPICGQTRAKDEPVVKPQPKPSVFDDNDDEEEAPARPARGGILSTVICVILAIAVVIGAMFILKALGVFGGKRETKPGELPQAQQTEVPPAAFTCTGISVSPQNMSFTELGQKMLLTILPEPETCTDPIEIVSSDPGVVSVTSSGEVIAVSEGTATITVACGAYSATVNVACSFLASGTVIPPAGETPAPAVAIDAAALKLNREDFTLNDEYSTFTMKLSGLPTGVEVTWTSDDPDIASIDKSGKVTAMKTGTTNVHATVQDITLDCIVRVSLKKPAAAAPAAAETTSADASGVAISHEDVTLKNGESFTISLRKDGAKLSGATWQSKDSTICTVTADGVVKAISAGTTQVTGTLNGTSYTCIVRCR